jgi:Carboxypeptidase regulatory-like domain
MRHIGRRGSTTRAGVRGAMLVSIALFGMMLAPGLAAAIVGPDMTPVVSAPAPVGTGAPTLSGTPALGQTLTCSTGTWANSPTSFSYVWLRSGVPIAGQTGGTYVVQPGDEGHAISCQVTASNGGGNYTIVGLPSGSYKVIFSAGSEAGNYLTQAYNDKPLFSEGAAVPVTAPNATGGINAELHAGGQISGRVVDAATKTPLSGIYVCAYDEVSGKVEYGGCAFTGAGGEYTISGLQSGSYTVQFSALFSESHYATQFYNGKASVAVTAGTTIAGINGELQSLNQNGQISGRVTKAGGGAAISGVEACAFESSGSEYFGGCAETNSNGEYTISGLAQAEYKVYFSANTCESEVCTQQNYIGQYFNDKLEYGEANPVAVTAGKVTENIDAKLAEGARIEGVVTKASGGAALEGDEVCAGGVGAAEFYSDCATTSGGGKYTLQALPTGEYTVTFSTTGNYLAQYYNGKSQFSEATPLSVTAGTATENIDAKMIEGGQITGRVTDASTHAPIREVEVCAGGSSVEIDSCDSTNGSGEYTLQALPNGSYVVGFDVDAEGLNYLSQSEEGVSVAPGTIRSGVNAELHPGGEITGRVTDVSTHGGIAGIGVCADGVGFEFEKCALTTTGGTSANASSNALTIAGGTFTLTKVSFNSKTSQLDFFFMFPTAGKLKWSLFFKNADVGFADSLGLGLGADESSVAEAARAKGKAKSKKCKKTETKHRGKCVATLVSFASGSETVPAGSVEVKVHADSKALRALKAGHTLHVSGKFTFQSALGGPAVSKTESATVRLSKKAGKSKHGKGKKR